MLNIFDKKRRAIHNQHSVLIPEIVRKNGGYNPEKSGTFEVLPSALAIFGDRNDKDPVFS